jgi:hypothetical protein
MRAARTRNSGRHPSAGLERATPKRNICLALLVVVLTTSACAGSDTGVATTTTQLNSGSTTFAIYIHDTGKRLLVRPGDEVLVRLPLAGLDDADWLLVTPPDPSVLGGGDNLRFYPSEPDQGEAYHEFTFVAVGPGEATVSLRQGSASSEAPTLSFTVEVVEP